MQRLHGVLFDEKWRGEEKQPSALKERVLILPLDLCCGWALLREERPWAGQVLERLFSVPFSALERETATAPATGAHAEAQGASACGRLRGPPQRLSVRRKGKRRIRRSDSGGFSGVIDKTWLEWGWKRGEQVKTANIAHSRNLCAEGSTYFRAVCGIGCGTGGCECALKFRSFYLPHVCKLVPLSPVHVRKLRRQLLGSLLEEAREWDWCHRPVTCGGTQGPVFWRALCSV